MSLRTSNPFVPLVVAGVLATCSAVFPAACGDSSAPGVSHGWLLIANKGDQSLGIVYPVANRQIAEIPEGGVTGHEVVASPDGKTGYVPIYGNSGVGKPGTDGTKLVEIDLAARKVVGALDF